MLWSVCGVSERRSVCANGYVDVSVSQVFSVEVCVCELWFVWLGVLFRLTVMSVRHGV